MPDTQVQLAVEKRNGVTGLVLTGFIPMEGEDGFGEETAGMEYTIPLKARGDSMGHLGLSDSGKQKVAQNKTAAQKQSLVYPADFTSDYEDLSLLKDGNKQLYVKNDGTLTADPYHDNDRRRVKSFIVTVPRQASNKRMFNKTINDENIIWPDGKVRRIAMEIKANDPMSPEEFREKKLQATSKRQQTSVAQIVQNDAAKLTAPLISKWRAAGKDNATIRTLLESMGEDFLRGAPEEIRNAAA